MWFKFALEYDEFIRSGKPEMVPQEEFLNYHRTGGISGNPYSQYTDDPDGLNWMHPEKFTLLLKSIERNGKHYEFRAEKEPNRYVKFDDDHNIIRDANNEPIYMTVDEMRAKNKKEFGTTVALFCEGKIIGFACDEFGASGAYLQKPFQGQGLGSMLMLEYLKESGRLETGNKIGQMTSWGRYMTRNLHKQIVEEAIQNGKEIPEEVMKDYPDLVKNESVIVE